MIGSAFAQGSVHNPTTASQRYVVTEALFGCWKKEQSRWVTHLQFSVMLQGQVAAARVHSGVVGKWEKSIIRSRHVLCLLGNEMELSLCCNR